MESRVAGVALLPFTILWPLLDIFFHNPRQWALCGWELSVCYCLLNEALVVEQFLNITARQIMPTGKVASICLFWSTPGRVGIAWSRGSWPATGTKSCSFRNMLTPAKHESHKSQEQEWYTTREAITRVAAHKGDPQTFWDGQLGAKQAQPRATAWDSTLPRHSRST